MATAHEPSMLLSGHAQNTHPAATAYYRDCISAGGPRLAQRVPVRIAIDKVPPGVPLVSGLTASVTIRNTKDGESRTVFQRARADLEDSFFGLFGGDPTRPGCIPNLIMSPRRYELRMGFDLLPCHCGVTSAVVFASLLG